MSENHITEENVGQRLVDGYEMIQSSGDDVADLRPDELVYLGFKRNPEDGHEYTAFWADEE